MKIKTNSIMNVLAHNGRVVLKMDRQSGFHQLTITKISGGYAVGEHPGGRICRMTESEVRQNIDDLAMFINSWG